MALALVRCVNRGIVSTTEPGLLRFMMGRGRTAWKRSCKTARPQRPSPSNLLTSKSRYTFIVSSSSVQHPLKGSTTTRDHPVCLLHPSSRTSTSSTSPRPASFFPVAMLPLSAPANVASVVGRPCQRLAAVQLQPLLTGRHPTRPQAAGGASPLTLACEPAHWR